MPNGKSALNSTNKPQTQSSENISWGSKEWCDDFLKSLPSINEVPSNCVLPNAIAELFKHTLSNFLSPQDFESLSFASNELAILTAFKRDEQKFKDTVLFRILSQYVLTGNQDNAELIIRQNPHFLYKIISKKNKVYDLLDNEFYGTTVFQIALISQDIEMAKMMVPYFESLTVINGKKELQAQYEEIYSNNIDSQYQPQKNKPFDFTEILNAIIFAPNNEVRESLGKNTFANTKLNSALNKFRKAFELNSSKEKVFNPQHLLRVYECYNKNRNKFSTDDKCNLFWRQVIGYVQRYLPACYLQAFAQGIYHMVGWEAELSRNFTCVTNNIDIKFGANKVGLGFDWAVLYESGKISCDAPISVPVKLFNIYLNSKLSGLKKLQTYRSDGPAPSI